MNILAKTKLYGLLFLEPNKAFQQLIEKNPTGVYVADENGNLVFVNSAFAQTLGYEKKEELLGKNLAKELYVNPIERTYFLKALEKTGSVKDYEVRNKRKDGSMVILSVTSNWVKDENQKVIGIEGIVHDITQKKRMEDAFSDEKDKLNQILKFEESLNLIHNEKQLQQFAVDQIAGILQAQKCSFMVYEPSREELFLVAAKGLEPSTIYNTTKKMGDPICGVVAQKKEALLVVNIEHDDIFGRHNRPDYPTRSFMSVPVMFGPQLLGVLNVADKLTTSWEVFTPTDLKMLCVMARAVAIALENARLFQRLEELAEGEPWSSLRHA